MKKIYLFLVFVIISQLSFSQNIVFTAKEVKFSMVHVSGGKHTLRDEKGKTLKTVLLKDYYIGETEVTQALWNAVMGYNPSQFKGANKPVENISYTECVRFITKLNQLTKKSFRIPSEAEWEYAALGGSKYHGYKYSGGNNLELIAWYDKNSAERTHNVKTKKTNELGIYDMTGNVYEWCKDDYDDDGNPKILYPQIKSTCKVMRSSSFDCDEYESNILYREIEHPDYKSNDLGLRIAM